MKKLSLGIQTFEKIIEEDRVYVDKTQYIYELIQENCLFLARPRRFGKSLLCSTLKNLFLGKKELFKGLWIEKNTDYKWPIHPVIHIDMSLVAKDTPEELTASLMRKLSFIAEQNDLDPLAHTIPGEMLEILIKRLYKKFGSKNRVVLIIDEYDKPILDNIENIDLAQKMRNTLKNFYEFFKGLDEYLRFVFVTGVTRIPKTSIFSGMNQIPDISMDPRFAHLVGYTKEEIDFYFKEHIQEIAYIKKMPPKEGIDELKAMLHSWYDGYRFWKDQQLLVRELEGKDIGRLYTPFSVLNFLFNADFSNYWFESGTPSFLIKILEQHEFPIESFNNLKSDINELTTFDLTNIPLSTLLFQSGYATIKKYDEASRLFDLELPNYEVKDSLLKSILAVITKHKTLTINSRLISLYNSLEAGNIQAFIDQIKDFYAKMPYTITIDKEKYYQTIFFLILQIINLKPDAEKATNIGRIDMIVETGKILYIFEFKLNRSAQEAISQILDMKYYEAYRDCGKKIKLLGVNFSSKIKNITEYLVQDLV
jgi:hypothetical protein